ncbi:MAG: ABC transporter permease [Verrucomicrobiae bacterium]|nr:ABC transporter permease [Verrucomicrobiae bacterium]
MTFLPVVARELRVQARQPATHRIRIFLALGLGLVAVVLLLGMRQNRSLTQTLFWLNSSLAFGWCLLSGAFLTADCLGGEQREGTLGLLFLTDLRPLDIVLGKLAATSLQAAFGLLAVLPILAWPLLMGGVTAGQFWRLALVLVVTQFVSLSLAACVSAFTPSFRQSLGRVLAILGIQTAGLSLLGALVGRLPLTGAQQWKRILGTVNPLQTLDFAMAPRMAGAAVPPWFHWGIGVLLLMGLAGIALASIQLRRLMRTAEAAETKKAGLLPRPVGLVGGGNPYAHLVSRERGWDALGLLLAGTGVVWLGLAAGVWLSPQGPAVPLFVASIFTAYGVHVLFKIRLILEATRQLSEDLRSGALEIVLSTPFPPAEIDQVRCRSPVGAGRVRPRLADGDESPPVDARPLWPSQCVQASRTYGIRRLCSSGGSPPCLAGRRGADPAQSP